MFGSDILDIAIGLILIYLLISLFCSAINEAIEHVLKHRAIDLRDGILELLKPTGATSTAAARTKEVVAARAESKASPATGAIATDAAASPAAAGSARRGRPEPKGIEGTVFARFYEHPLITALVASDVKKWSRWNGSGLPSYIPEATFAKAIVAILIEEGAATSGDGAMSAESARVAMSSAGASRSGASTAQSEAARLEVISGYVSRGIDALSNDPGIQASLRALYLQAGGEMNAFVKELESWFNSGMDRVSGWYKRRAQRIIFIAGALIAIAMNVDTIELTRALSSNATMREGLVAIAPQIYSDGKGMSQATEATRANEDDADAGAAGASGTAGASGQARTAEAVADTGAAGAPVAGRAAEAGGGAGAAGASGAAGPTDAPGAPVTSGVVAAAGDAELIASERSLDRYEQLVRATGVPIGWRYPEDRKTNMQRLEYIAREVFSPMKALGLLLTTLAVSLGAPFWFDVLNKVMVIRATVKPREKSREEASEDRR